MNRIRNSLSLASLLILGPGLALTVPFTRAFAQEAGLAAANAPAAPALTPEDRAIKAAANAPAAPALTPEDRAIKAAANAPAASALTHEDRAIKAAANANAAKQLIVLAGLTDIFEALPDPEQILAVHPASGLVCLLHPGRFGKEIFLASVWGKRGEDVGCRAQGGANAEFTETIFVTRLPNVEPAFWFLDAIKQIKTTWRLHRNQKDLPGFRLEEEFPASMANFRARPPAGTSFIGVNQGDPAFTSVRVAGFGDWKFKQRLTAPIASAAAASDYGRESWQQTMRLRMRYFEAATPAVISPGSNPSDASAGDKPG